MPIIICLPTFAVIDLFRFVHPAKADRATVILNLGLAARPAIGLNVITLGDFPCIHFCIG